MTAAKEKALAALLASKSVTEAAQASGIGERTIRRYLKEDAEFSQEYLNYRTALMDETAAHLQAALTTAADTLARACDDISFPPGCRISAARALLDMGLKYVETANILRRLDALEAAARE